MAKRKSFLDKIRGDTSSLGELEELMKELLELRISLSSGQLRETHKIKKIKRSIAQFKTVEKEKGKEKND